MKIIPSFFENGPPCPILEMDRLSTGWLVRRMPQRTGCEMVGLWSDWKNDVKTLRRMVSHRTHGIEYMKKG